MSSHKVEKARKVFQNLGSPAGEATRLAHVAEQAWSLCIRMNSGKLEDAPINMSLRDLAAIYGASNQSDGSNLTSGPRLRLKKINHPCLKKS